MADQIYFNSCEELDSFFREGREYFNDLYVKKLVTNSTYFTRFEEQPWPLNHTTEQKAFRFGRGFYDPCTPFNKINDTYCSTDSCATNSDLIQRPGTESYTFELLRKEMHTDWICVESLLYRLFPAEEILQFEESNARITKNVHEEFLRANYIGQAGHKWVGFTTDDGTYCGLLDDQSWFIPEHSVENTAGYDLCHVRVKCAVADLPKIAYLSLDMLDDALIELQNEDDAFRLDIAEATGMQLLDIVIPDPRVGRALYFQAKRNNGYWDANTDFDARLSSLKLGVNRVIGDYAFGYDINAARYNKAPAAQQPVAPFSPTDPATWALLVRVPRYVKVVQENGCSYVPNRDYAEADFAISTAMVNKAMVKWTMPSSTGYGKAQMQTQNYAGDWEWRNPDWECNRWRKMGYYQAQFRLAAQVKDPTLIHVFLHRLPKSKNLYGSCCALNDYTPSADPADCYNCAGVGDIQAPV